MRISKWVDMGQEVEIEIGMDDVRAAITEAFSNVTKERFLEEGPNAGDVILAFNAVGIFFNALKEEHVSLLSDKQKEVIAKYLGDQAERLKKREAVPAK